MLPEMVRCTNQGDFPECLQVPDVCKVGNQCQTGHFLTSADRRGCKATLVQDQQWLGNNLPPQDWGWTMKGDVLVPNQTEDPPAPQVLLQTIFCRFMKDCSSGKCSCRKAMLSCNTACSHCQGSCLNGIPFLDENEDEEYVSPDPNIISTSITTEGNRSLLV
uniref:Uncharacterized protein n=1 Tax=Cacopsylla melanoneura TaxID=428564 RepID=A0A8D8REL5_9HEMI